MWAWDNLIWENEENGIIFKGHRNQLEGMSSGQIWDNMNIKKNNDDNWIEYQLITVEEMMELEKKITIL